MSDKDSTGIIPACKQQDVSTIEIYPNYWRWERAFRRLTGWPPKPVAVEELRRELAVGIPMDGLSRDCIEQSISVEEAIQNGVLTRFSSTGKVKLATLEETLQLKNGYVRLVWPKWTKLEPDSTGSGGVTEERI